MSTEDSPESFDSAPESGHRTYAGVNFELRGIAAVGRAAAFAQRDPPREDVVAARGDLDRDALDPAVSQHDADVAQLVEPPYDPGRLREHARAEDLERGVRAAVA